jgi:hypothetical protein
MSLGAESGLPMAEGSFNADPAAALEFRLVESDKEFGQRLLEATGVFIADLDDGIDEDLDGADAPDNQWYDRTRPQEYPVNGRAPGMHLSEVDHMDTLPVDDRLASGEEDTFQEMAIAYEVDKVVPFDDTFVDIVQELDAEDELGADVTFDLLQDCHAQADMLKGLYKYTESKVDVENYVEELFRNELLYIKAGLRALDTLLYKNFEAGIKLKKLNVLWDLDRSQVLVVDLPGGQGRDHRMIYSENKTDDVAPTTHTEHGTPYVHHLPRAGWPILERLMRRKLDALGIDMASGVLSDRPFVPKEQADTLQEGLVAVAQRTFDAAGIKLDPLLVTSSTDGAVASNLPDFMQTQQRRKMREKGADISPQRLAADQLGQVENIVDLDAPDDPDAAYVYHEKIGVVSAMAKDLPEGEVILWVDDHEGTLFVLSTDAAGFHVHPAFQPLAPDDREIRQLMSAKPVRKPISS